MNGSLKLLAGLVSSNRSDTHSYAQYSLPRTLTAHCQARYRTRYTERRMLFPSISDFPLSLKARSHWWNSEKTVMKQVESEWISNETICFMAVKTLIRMKQCFTIMKHLESGWIDMNQCVSWQWNTLNQDESGWISVFHGNETPWVRSSNHTDIITAMLITYL